MKKKRPDQDATFTGTIMFEKSQQMLRHILEPSLSGEKSFIGALSLPDKVIFGKAQNAYGACMDEGRLKALGSGPLIEVLRMIEKNFPAIKPEGVSVNPPRSHQHQQPLLAGENTEENLTKTLTYLEKIGVTALVSFSISVCIPCCEGSPMQLIPATRPTIKIQTLSSCP